jgi:tetratricopeptide (TPR) repeat protein
LVLKKSIFSLLYVFSITIGISQNNAYEFYQNALINEASLDYWSALRDIDNALKINPKYDSALYLGGTINYKLGEFKKAEK